MAVARTLQIIRQQLDAIQPSAFAQKAAVTIVAISKTVDASKAVEALKNGVFCLGESRIQDALIKFFEIDKRYALPYEKHLVGHLQKNKVHKAVEIFDLIHSLDSLSLADKVNQAAKEISKVQRVLLQINVSNNSAQFGLPINKVLELITACAEFDHLRIAGLMCIAPFFADRELTRPYFREVSKLFQSLSKQKLPANAHMQYLSMGMTNDFPVAVEEGANMVRIGRGIFG